MGVVGYGVVRLDERYGEFMEEGNNIIEHSTELAERVEAIVARPWHLLWGSPVRSLEEELGELEQYLTDNENNLAAQYDESELRLVRMNVTKVTIQLGVKRHKQAMSFFVSGSVVMGVVVLCVVFM